MYQSVKRPVIAFIRALDQDRPGGRDWEDAIIDATVEATKPFLSEELFVTRAIDVQRRNDTGHNWGYRRDAPFMERSKVALRHMLEPFEPGTLTSARRVIKGITGEVTLYGKAYDPKVEALATIGGQRVSTLDVPQSLSWEISRLRQRQKGAGRLLSDVASRRGTVTEQEIRVAYETAENAKKAVFDQMVGVVGAARRYGKMTDKEIFRVLTASGMSKKETRRVLDARYVPYTPTERYLSTVVKRIRATPTGKGATVEDMIARRQLIRNLAAERRTQQP
jgi:hypothetical protein